MKESLEGNLAVNKEGQLESLSIEGFEDVREMRYKFSFSSPIQGRIALDGILYLLFKEHPEYFHQKKNILESGAESDFDNFEISEAGRKTLEENIRDMDQLVPKDWVTFGEKVGYENTSSNVDISARSKLNGYMQKIIEQLAVKYPQEVKPFRNATEDKNQREWPRDRKGYLIPGGVKYYYYYSPFLVQKARELIEEGKSIKKKDDWYTKYQTAKKLHMSQKTLEELLVKYRETDPEYFVQSLKDAGNTNQEFIYKSLVEEINKLRELS